MKKLTLQTGMLQTYVHINLVGKELHRVKGVCLDHATKRLLALHGCIVDRAKGEQLISLKELALQDKMIAECMGNENDNMSTETNED